MSLDGKVVWITGASAGIGAATARELARRGATVVATARRADALEELAAQNPGVVALPGDITDADGMAALAARIVTQHGAIDIALLNAGTYTPVLPEDFRPELFRPQIEVNLMGTVNCIAAVLPHMRRRGSGRIAVVASVTGFAALPMASAYGATKAFLISMADSLRADLAGEGSGVAVTVIAPGFVTTDLTGQNDFEMPFVIEAPEAATFIADGLEAGRAEIAFPRRMNLAMKAVGRWLPGPLRRRYVAGIARRRHRDRAKAAKKAG
jgi:NAD(P)-dependent dehydrogenase (short-subunit alcohol dehydrogenase family)